ncbi:MAG: HPF/RaiA family ribosome-associated protein [Chitinophagaceae bacterium]|nr:HPF/RaiA family ribosome-associated protein [Chitinophagaceae bacterium]
MTIQINTDKNIDGNERLVGYVTETISQDLHRFAEYLTRVEVHFADENGNKDGIKDKRCILEARIENRQPIAVTGHGNSTEQALQESLHKLKATMDTYVSKLKDH